MFSSTSNSYVSKTHATFYLGFAMERITRHFIILNVFSGKTTLCRRQHALSEPGLFHLPHL